MERVLIALLLALFAVSANAAESRMQRLGDGQGVICADCEPDDGGGGTGGTGGETGSTTMKLVRAEVRPQDHTIELRFSNGLMYVIDEPLNKMWMSAPGKATVEYNLGTALLQWAGGNAATAAALRAKLHAAATDPSRNSLLVPSTSSTSGLTYTGSTRGGLGRSGIMMDGSKATFNCFYYYYDCRTTRFDDWGGGGSFSYDFLVDGTGGGGSGTTDWNYWNRWRQDHCDDAGDNARDFWLGVGTLVVTCPFAETGIGAVGCAAGGLTAFNSYTDWSENHQVCASSYPGPGAW